MILAAPRAVAQLLDHAMRHGASEAQAWAEVQMRLRVAAHRMQSACRAWERGKALDAWKYDAAARVHVLAPVKQSAAPAEDNVVTRMTGGPEPEESDEAPARRADQAPWVDPRQLLLPGVA